MQKFIYELVNNFLMNKVERELINHLKNKENIIFDVGCYRGNFTSNLIKFNKNNKKTKYYMFDANPNSRGYCKKVLDNKNVSFFELALDNTNKKKTFTINNYFEASGSSLRSAHEKDKLYNFTRRIVMFFFEPFKHKESYKKIIVQTQTLDKFCKQHKIKKINLLKLDTEGTEHQILLGAKNLLSKGKIDIIYSEVTGPKKIFKKKVKLITDYLSKYNFKLAKTYKISSLGTLSNLQGSDNLFIRS